jgi:hypothetical protein
LLYVAIYKRVADYGITEARYFLILLAAFITGAMLYLIFSRKQQLRFLPMALTGLALLGSFGFWGAFSVSAWSQKKQFKEVYTAFAKLPTGQARADTITISRAQADRFVSIAKYLNERDLLHTTEDLLGYNPKIEFPNASSWSIGDEMLKKEGITSLSNPLYYISKNFNVDATEPIDIEGYSWMNTMYLNEDASNLEYSHILQGYRFSINAESEEVHISKNQQTVLRIALTSLRKSLFQRDDRATYNIPPEEMMIEGENERIKVKIYFEQLNFTKNNNTYELESSRARALLNIKQ